MKKPRNRNRAKEKVILPENYKATFLNSFKQFWFLYGIFTACTGYTIVNIFIPKIDMSVGATLNQKEAFKTVMVIKNNSEFFSLSDVKPELIIGELRFDLGGGIKDATLMDDRLGIKKISAGESSPYMFDLSNYIKDENGKPFEIQHGLLGFYVKYDFLFISMHRYFYFKTALDAEGNAIWMAIPASQFPYKHVPR